MISPEDLRSPMLSEMVLLAIAWIFGYSAEQ